MAPSDDARQLPVGVSTHPREIVVDDTGSTGAGDAQPFGLGHDMRMVVPLLGVAMGSEGCPTGQLLGSLTGGDIQIAVVEAPSVAQRDRHRPSVAGYGPPVRWVGEARATRGDGRALPAGRRRRDGQPGERFARVSPGGSRPGVWA